MNYLTPVLLSTNLADGNIWTFVDYILNSNVLNNIAVLLFLIWLVKKFDMLSVIEKTQKDIDKEISHAETKKEETKEELSTVELEYENIESELSSVKETSKQIANSLVEEIHKGTQKEVDDITHKTAKNLEEETTKAYGDVATYISKAALNIAEEHIKKSVDINLHKKFIYDFIDDLDKIKV